MPNIPTSPPKTVWVWIGGAFVIAMIVLAVVAFMRPEGVFSELSLRSVVVVATAIVVGRLMQRRSTEYRAARALVFWIVVMAAGLAIWIYASRQLPH